jgi:undecaprenyl-diphosphatase
MRRPSFVVLGGFAALLAAGIGSGLLLHAAVGTGPTGLDQRVTDWFVARRGPGLTEAVRSIQFLGRSELMFAVVAIAGVLLVTDLRRVGMLLLVACVGAETFVDVIKPAVGRQRPPARLWLEHTGRGAYPSGHALISTVVVMVVVAAIGMARGRPVPRAVWCAAAVVPLAVGLSRVYLGVHWLTDVLAGWLIGGVWIVLVVHAVTPAVAAPDAPGTVATPSP